MSALTGRTVRALDTAPVPEGTRGVIESAEAAEGCRAVCTVAFEDGTHAGGLRLGPYGLGDIVLVDTDADPALYDTSRYAAELRRARALAGLDMYAGLLATLEGGR